MNRTPIFRSELSAGAPAYLLLPPDVVPEAWRERGVTLTLIALLPEEGRHLLAEGRTAPALDAEEARIAQLVGRGLGVTEIATRMGTSTRTAERRLARLRRRFGVRTTAELTALFAGATGGGITTGDVGGFRSLAENPRPDSREGGST